MDPSESEMQQQLDKGRTQMDEAMYANALGSIMKAINACPCRPASHGKDKSCNISQCILAVRGSDSDPDSLYRVATGPCSCGFKWPSCTRPLHLEAVDTLAACLEKAKRYTAAFSTALGLIRLDPASPIGYCRVTKIIRYLVKNHKGPDQDVTRSLAVLLRDAKLSDIKKLHECLTLFVKHGLRNTEKYRHSPDNKYHVILRQMSHNLKLPQSRKDPFTKLPRELIGMIFSHLDTTALIRCCRVNKTWRRIIETDSMLWSTISLKKPRSSRYFVKFLQRHRTMRRLLIDDFSCLKLSPDKLIPILRLPHLRHLRIEGAGALVSAPGDTSLMNIRPDDIAPLVRLSLLGKTVSQNTSRTWTEIVEKTASGLEVLELGLAPMTVFEPIGLPLANLKKLYVTSQGAVSISHIASCAPNLEHLYLVGCSIQNAQAMSTLRSLHSLSIGEGCRAGLSNFDSENFGLPRTLRVLELLHTNQNLTEQLFGGVRHSSNFPDTITPTTTSTPTGPSHEPEPEPLQFPNMEIFRIRFPLSPSSFNQLLGQALQNGSLKVLELAMPFHLFNQILITEPAKEYPSASSDHVHTIGLYNFSWPDTYADELSAAPFLDWLKRFPNVTTVTAYPAKTYEGALSFFSRLICHPGIKVIHQERLQGVEWDQAQELAKKLGVQLLHTKNGIPIGWPVNE